MNKQPELLAPTVTDNRLPSNALLGSVARSDTFDEGWNAALHALRELCDDRMGGFRGYSWDSGAGSSGYDEALGQIIKWADAVKQSTTLPPPR